jgi:hypothetical protein
MLTPRLLVVLALISVAVAVHAQRIRGNAQELFHNKTLPRDWMSSQVLKPRLKALTGRDAVNCGRASIPPQLEMPVLHFGLSQDTSRSSLTASDVSDCALQAYAHRKSFYARYDLQSIDSFVELGFAFDGRKVYAVIWQRMIGWGDEQTLNVKDCPLPIRLTKNESGWLDCFVADPTARPAITSPQPESLECYFDGCEQTEPY